MAGLEGLALPAVTARVAQPSALVYQCLFSPGRPAARPPQDDPKYKMAAKIRNKEHRLRAFTAYCQTKKVGAGGRAGSWLSGLPQPPDCCAPSCLARLSRLVPPSLAGLPGRPLPGKLACAPNPLPPAFSPHPRPRPGLRAHRRAAALVPAGARHHEDPGRVPAAQGGRGGGDDGGHGRHGAQNGALVGRARQGQAGG